MGRRLRYQVAVSLDGFIAGPNGDYDWIVMDPAIDFAALFKAAKVRPAKKRKRSPKKVARAGKDAKRRN